MGVGMTTFASRVLRAEACHTTDIYPMHAKIGSTRVMKAMRDTYDTYAGLAWSKSKGSRPDSEVKTVRGMEAASGKGKPGGRGVA